MMKVNCIIISINANYFLCIKQNILVTLHSCEYKKQMTNDLIIYKRFAYPYVYVAVRVSHP